MKKAFSLIELIIAIAIIAIVMGLFFANYNAGESRANLINTREDIIKDLYYAQSQSYGGQILGTATTTPAGGWGVYFDIASTSYAIFADLDGDNLYSAEELDREVELPDNISFSSLGGEDILSITFPTDTFRAHIYDGSATSSEAEIILLDNIEAATSSVYINYAGLIEKAE